MVKSKSRKSLMPSEITQRSSLKPCPVSLNLSSLVLVFPNTRTGHGHAAGLLHRVPPIMGTRLTIQRFLLVGPPRPSVIGFNGRTFQLKDALVRPVVVEVEKVDMVKARAFCAQVDIAIAAVQAISCRLTVHPKTLPSNMFKVKIHAAPECWRQEDDSGKLKDGIFQQLQQVLRAGVGAALKQIHAALKHRRLKALRNQSQQRPKQ
uniref:Uncharacterized protein n=2 Tax=Cacopsylla melanoneura TaxID=428564 RepID=A0A8D8XEJ9_9HEMI